MHRLVAPSALALALASSACGAESAVWASTQHPRLLAGAPTVVTLQLKPDCAHYDTRSVTLASGEAAPAWLAIATEPFYAPAADGSYPISNPGEGKPFDGGGGGFDPTAPASLGQRTHWSFMNGLQVVLTPGAAAPVAPVALQVRVTGCGRVWTATLFAETVAPAPDLGGFCGWSSGEACAADAECARVPWRGDVCALASAGSLAVNGLSCADPVAAGAVCGCVAGTCGWRPRP